MPARCELGQLSRAGWLGFLGTTCRVAASSSAAAGQGTCTGGCVELGTPSQVPVSLVQCVQVYLLPCSSCPECVAECFSSGVRASHLPPPKALVILHSVTRSFHGPTFLRTLGSLSSDTADLDPSLLNPEPDCPLSMGTGSRGRVSISDPTTATATLAFCLPLQVARILKFVLVV